MFSHSTNTASFFSVLIAALIFSLSLAGLLRRRATLGACLSNRAVRSWNSV